MEKDVLQSISMTLMVVPAVWREQKTCLHEHLLASLTAG